MSTSTVTAFAGAAIGFAVGGPVGAQWGFMAGSIVGSLVDPQKISGPRLTDLTVQSATEGTPIPLAFGSVRIAGNVLQCSPKRERSHTSRAGKGGPQSTTYTYDVDIAVGLCVGPIQGVSRIWANGALIYDSRPTASASTLLASGKIAAGIKIYLGSETQMPDPTLEALSGVGKTPAYRGMAYVVFSTLQLEKFGNNIPNFTFEVIASGSSVPYRRLTAKTIPQQWKTSSISGLGYPTIYSADDVVRVGVAGGLGGTTYIYDMEGNFLGSETRTATESQWPISEFSMGGGTWSEGVGRTWDGAALYMLYPYRRILGTGGLLYVQAAFGVAIHADGGLPSGRQLLSCCMSADGRYIFSITAPAGSMIAADQWHITEWTGSSSILVRQGAISGDASIDENSFGPGNTAKGFGAGMMENNLEYVWSVWGAGGGDVIVYQIGPDDVLRRVKTFSEAVSSDGLVPGGFSRPSVFADRGVAVTVNGNGLCVHTRIPSVSGSSPTLGSIVSALCTRAGLQSGDIDVTQLTDTVTGYVIGQQGTARAGIDPLRSYRPFDVAEDSGKLVFVPRGGPQVAVIPWDDLAAHDGGDMPDPLTITVADETELPTVATVVYNDPAADYQVASQTARRNRLSTSGQLWPIAPANNVVRIELPIGMSAAQASRAADVLLWDAFTSRKAVEFSVGLKYAALRATDPVQIVGPDATYGLRVTKIEEQGLLRKVSAVFEDAAVYEAAPAAGVAGGIPGQTVPLDGPTRLQLMDIPLLRDADDNAGYYVAMAGYLPGWPGGTLYKSVDGGGSWDEALVVANPATMGVASTALGNFGGGNILDELNAVTIVINGGGELASVTLLALLNGGNAALLGDEIIQYRTATLTAPNTYVLTGLLRGRKGSEDGMATHVVGERFVALSGVAGLARLSGSAAEIGLERQYKPITAGGTLDDVAPTKFTNTGRSLKPLAPVLPGAGRDAGGNVVMTWVRRTRIGGEWRDSVDATLGESSEAYEVDILSAGGAVVRTLKSATPTVTYWSDDCLADFGFLTLSLHVRIYQVSATIGRGMPLDTTFGLSSFSKVVNPMYQGLAPAMGNRNALPVCSRGDKCVVVCTGFKDTGAAALKLCRRYFGSTDGIIFTQIGADYVWDTLPGSIWRPDAGVVDMDDSGRWLGWGNFIDPQVTEIVFGTLSAYPVSRGAGPFAADRPLSISAYGSQFFISTLSGKLYSTTDGTSFTLVGTLPAVGALWWVGSSWIQYRDVAGKQWPDDSETPSVWTTTGGNPVTATWTKRVDCPSVSGAPWAYLARRPVVGAGAIYLDVIGYRPIPTGTEVANSVVLRSTDGGATWAVDILVPGQVFGAYPAGFVPASRGGIMACSGGVCRISPAQNSNGSIGNTSLRRYAAGDWRITAVNGIPMYYDVGTSAGAGAIDLSCTNYMVTTSGFISDPTLRVSTDGLTWKDPVVVLTP